MPPLAYTINNWKSYSTPLWNLTSRNRIYQKTSWNWSREYFCVDSHWYIYQQTIQETYTDSLSPKRPHTYITTMIDNINMDISVAGLVNARTYSWLLLANMVLWLKIITLSIWRMILLIDLISSNHKHLKKVMVFTRDRKTYNQLVYIKYWV